MSEYNSDVAELFNPVGTDYRYSVSAYDNSNKVIASGIKSFHVGSGTCLKNIAGVVFDHNAQY